MTVEGYTDFALEVVLQPHIVVSGKYVNWNTSVSNLGQFPEKAYVAPWHYPLPLKPEFKQVTNKVKSLRIGFPAMVQPSHNLVFPLTAGDAGRNAQVKIGCKINSQGRRLSVRALKRSLPVIRLSVRALNAHSLLSGFTVIQNEVSVLRGSESNRASHRW